MSKRERVGISRELGIDFLRMLSMFLVAVLHVLGQGGVLKHTEWMSGQYMTAWFWEVVAFCAVNCFALVSGYVGVNSRFRWSRILNLWLQVIFYTLGITIIYSIVMPEKVGVTTWIKALFPVTTGQYWYITAYAGMFVFIPFMNLAVEKASRKSLELFFAVVFIFFCVFSSVLHQDPYGLSGGYSMAWLGILYLVGGYIKKYNIAQTITRRMSLVLFLASSILAWLSKLTIEVGTDRLFGKTYWGGTFISYISPFIIVNAISLLCFFANTEFKPGMMQKIIMGLSPAALGVYIIHVNPLIWQTMIAEFAAPLATMQPVLLTGGVLICALCVYSVCSLIDILRINLFRVLRVKCLCRKFDNMVDALAGKLGQ